MFTLHNGDCMQYLDSLQDGSIDLVITSPPYNMAVSPGGNGRGIYRTSKNSKGARFHYGYGVHSDDMPQEKYNEWQRAVLKMCWSKVKDTGAIFYNHKPRVEHGKIRLPLDFDFGIPLRQIITWDRLTGIGVNLRHYCSAYEWIFLFAKKDFRLKDHSSSGQSDMWNLGMEYKETNHPAPFPLSLPVKVITTAQIADVVCDPFMGSGTVGVACVQEGKSFIGCEIDPRYFSIAEKRIKSAVLSPSFSTPSNNRLHSDAGDSPRQQALFTPEANPAEGKLPTPTPRR